MKSFSCVLLALVWTVLQQPMAAWGQELPDEDLLLSYGDKSSVSIATGSQLPLRRAPAVATVITAEDIAAMGATDLDQVLESVPGMHVSRSANNYTPLYVIRGIYTEFNPQTLVLQNGVPMTTLFVGSRGIIWAGLPLDNVARIEVIRGPGSALYGADAFSGVINIITKTAADVSGTEVGTRVGSFGSRDAWVQHGGKLGSMDVAAYMRVGRSDGYQRTIEADAQTPTDTTSGTHASLAPGPVNTGFNALDGSLDMSYESWRMHVGYKLRSNVGTGAGVGSALDPVGKGRSERITADVSKNDIELGKDWRLGISASYLHYVQDFDTSLQILPPGARNNLFPNGMIGSPKTWERQIRLSATTTYGGFANHKVRLGVGHDDLDLYKTQELKNFDKNFSPTSGSIVIDAPADQIFMVPQRRRVDYVYAQDEWSFLQDWSLTAGLRHDHYSDFGGTTNPRLALVWDAAYDLTAKLLYGRAFRAPSFTEQYSVNNPVAIGNPNLRPETIDSLELAFAWQANSETQVNVGVFGYQMKDIIRTTSTGGGTPVYNNVGGQTGRGFELEGTWDASRKLRLHAQYAYQESTDDATGKDAGYAPHHHIYGRADWRFAAGWIVGAQVNWVADRRRASGDTRPAIADYTTVDMQLSTTAKRQQWSFALGLRNLFNADVREPSFAPGTAIPNDLPMAPFSAYVQASYRM
jgi:outer membrane receptor protein involved in Fe transport